jgi:propionyl-CoA synthetase
MAGEYQRTYDAELGNPEAFWGESSREIQWYRRYDTALDATRSPFLPWFSGGQLSTCYNALDWHVENGRARAGG